METGGSSWRDRFSGRFPVLTLVIAVLVIASIFLQIGIDPERTALGLANNTVESTAAASLSFLGGVRSAAAAYIWLKVDRLHDDYYNEDFKKEEELIPLYRIATWLDPQLVDAYYVGSYLLFQFGRADEGWRFALEGLRLNPESAKMELNCGQLALFYRKDYREAVVHLERAVKLAQTDDLRLTGLKDLEVAYQKAGMTEKANAVAAFLAQAFPALKPAGGMANGETKTPGTEGTSSASVDTSEPTGLEEGQ